MKTHKIFLFIGITMFIIEMILGYIVFGLSNTWIEQLLLIGLISVGILVIAITFVMYKDNKTYEKLKN